MENGSPEELTWEKTSDNKIEVKFKGKSFIIDPKNKNKILVYDKTKDIYFDYEFPKPSRFPLFDFLWRNEQFPIKERGHIIFNDQEGKNLIIGGNSIYEGKFKLQNDGYINGQGTETLIKGGDSYTGNFEKTRKQGDFVFKRATDQEVFNIKYIGDMPTFSGSLDLKANEDLLSTDAIKELLKYCHYSNTRSNGRVFKTTKLTLDLTKVVQNALLPHDFVCKHIDFGRSKKLNKDNVKQFILEEHKKNTHKKDNGLYIVSIPGHVFLAFTNGRYVLTINDLIDQINIPDSSREINQTKDPKGFLSVELDNFRISGGPCLTNAEAYLLIAAKSIIEQDEFDLVKCFDEIRSTVRNLRKEDDHEKSIDFIKNIFKEYINKDVDLKNSFLIGNTNIPGENNYNKITGKFPNMGLPINLNNAVYEKKDNSKSTILKNNVVKIRNKNQGL